MSIKTNKYTFRGISIFLVFILILTSFQSSSFKQLSADSLSLDKENPIHYLLKNYVEDFDRHFILPQEYDYHIQPYVLDLDGDQVLEAIIIGYDDNTGTAAIFLYQNDGIVENWPVELFLNTNNIEVVGKIDLNGGSEHGFILRYTTVLEGNYTTSFVAIKEDRQIEPNFSISLNGSFNQGTIYFDLNKDGEEELALLGHDGLMRILDLEGNDFTNWPIQIPENESTKFIPPVIEDINKDDEYDVIVCTDTGMVYAWNLNGSLVKGFPFRIPVNYFLEGEEFRTHPLVDDFNNDGKKELSIASTFGYLYIMALEPPNSTFWDIAIPSVVYSSTHAVSYDIDNDGYHEIIQSLPNGLIVLRLTTELEVVFYIPSETNVNGFPAIADIDSDNKAEIIITNYLSLKIIDGEGNIIKSVTRFLSASDTISPIVYDVDNDNEIEIVHISQRGQLSIDETNDFGLAPWIHVRGSLKNTIDLDSDNDGLWDFEEEIIGTSKNNFDTDTDTISDGLEVNQYILNPLNPDVGTDSDDDGLSNIIEVDNYYTNPLNPDSDGDSISDGDEVLQYSTNPLSGDSDNDGMPDSYEILYDSLDPNDSDDALEDGDNDNLNNIDEMAWGTNPENPDSDGDGLLDGDEIMKYFTNPNLQDADVDYDQDGLTNVEEVDIYNTNPLLADSDGDGYDDGIEITEGSDPLDPSSVPSERTSYITFASFIPQILVLGIIVLKLKKRRR
ncbi:MAG: hypothetical protein HGN29_08625 [Asgard group archaeon]|nr:hypothetical protein [Asgard group archaeon]